MQCNHCHSVMEQTREETNPLSSVTWYKCSVCGTSKLVSLPRVRHISTHEIPVEDREATTGLVAATPSRVEL